MTVYFPFISSGYENLQLGSGGPGDDVSGPDGDIDKPGDQMDNPDGGTDNPDGDADTPVPGDDAGDGQEMGNPNGMGGEFPDTRN